MFSRRHRTVPNYTNAFLVTVFGILFMGFWVLAALAGGLWVFVVALGLNHLITALDRRLAR